MGKYLDEFVHVVFLLEGDFALHDLRNVHRRFYIVITDTNIIQTGVRQRILLVELFLGIFIVVRRLARLNSSIEYLIRFLQPLFRDRRIRLRLRVVRVLHRDLRHLPQPGFPST